MVNQKGTKTAHAQKSKEETQTTRPAAATASAGTERRSLPLLELRDEERQMERQTERQTERQRETKIERDR